MKRTHTLIIGAGLAGLGCALKTGGDFLVCEKNASPGGLCRTKAKDGFLFDTCAHLLHFRAPEAREFITRDLGIKLKTFRKNAYIQTSGRLIRHPFQHHLNGLDRDEAAAALLGFVNARINPLYPAYYSADTFHDWLMRSFGTGICRSFMLPYNRKFWKTPLKKMTCEWVSKFIALPTLEQVIEGAMLDTDKEYGYNSSFMYPESGGISRIADKMAARVKDRVLYKSGLVRLDTGARVATFSNGMKISYKRLVSTMPLPELGKTLASPPETITRSMAALKYLSVLNVNFGTGRERARGRNWVYCPDAENTCFRFGFPTTYSSCAPDGRGNVYTETTFLPGQNPTELKTRVENELAAQGILEDLKVTDTNVVPFAYVIFDRARQESLKTIGDWAEKSAVSLCGRYGRWDYMSMEESLLDGMQLALTLNSGRVGA